MTKSNRRKFIGAATALCAGAVFCADTNVAAIPVSGSQKKPPLAHHVFFWLKNPASVEDRDKLVEGVKTLSKIPTAGQAVYQDHPIHLEFIKNYGHLWEKVVVYDAMEV